MRIDLLCSGSKGNSCLIRENDSAILIDCGCTKKYLLESLQRVGACMSDIDGVLITHAHKDHVGGLKFVSHLPVYSHCLLKEKMDKQDIYPDEIFFIKDFKITVLALSHDSPNTIGFVVETMHDKLVYITDTGYIPNHIKPLICNARHYIFESNHDIDTLMHTSRPMFLKQRILSDSGHLNNVDASLNLSQIINTNTRDIVLAHISQEANTSELALDSFYDVMHKKDLNVRDVNVVAAEQFKIVTLD